MDYTIALQSKGPQIESPIEAQGKVLQLRQLMQADQAAQIQMQQHRQAMADDASYRAALQANPNGGEGLKTALATSGNYKGHAAAVKADLDARKGNADINKTEVDARKTQYDMLKSANGMVGSAAGWLQANPTYENAVGAINNLKQKLGPEVSAMLGLDTVQIPQNPADIAKWANEYYMASIDTDKQLADERLRSEGDKNRTVQVDNSKRSAQVQREGHALTDNRAREYNAITREAGASQVVETPQGFMTVNKGTGMARPIAMGNQPVLGKDSTTAKNAQMADRLIGMIPLAKQLLESGATSSGAGAVADDLMGFVGVSTKGMDAANALETVSGWMTSNVPRFEGPQSDKDTATYRTMAGIVGDRTKPISTRLKAMETVEALMQPYAGNRTLPFSGPPGTQPATTVAPRPLLPGRGGASAPAAPVSTAPEGAPPLDSFFK